MLQRICQLAVVVVAISLPASAQPLYVNDFESGDVAGWTSNVIDQTFQRSIAITRAPNSSTQFLGDFGNQSVTFIRAGLPLHDSVIVEFDLYVIRTWDGNANDDNGPDVFTVFDEVSGVLLRTSFANQADRVQSYPGQHPADSYLGFTGAVSTQSLGYTVGGEATYRLRVAYAHTARTLALTLGATLRDEFPTLANESWGIDNISITLTDPLPSSATLAVGSAIGAPGERVFIPISVRDAVSVLSSGATSIRARMRFNGSMLMPETPTPEGRIEGGDRVIDLDIPLNIAGDSSIAIFNFRVALGDDTLTTITLESLSAVGGTIALSPRAGTFRVRGLCTDGGTRLFRNQRLSLLHPPSPNPASEQTNIRYYIGVAENVRVELLNASGALEQTLSCDVRGVGEHNVMLDASALASGRYIVRMSAGRDVQNRELYVVR